MAEGMNYMTINVQGIGVNGGISVQQRVIEPLEKTKFDSSNHTETLR